MIEQMTMGFPGGLAEPRRPERTPRETKRLAESLGRIESGLPLEPAPHLAPLVHWRRADASPIHRWYRYREGYSPELIRELSLGGRVLDPFCGCGSIMVGAAEQGREAVGVDVNPLAVFVARVKLTPLTDAELERVRAFAQAFRSLAAATPPWPLPGLSIAGKVFEPEILAAILRLRSALEAEAAGAPRVRDFLLLAWLEILERVGSYFKEGNGIKYRNRKRLKSGYVVRAEGKWQRERFGDDQTAFVHTAFARQLGAMLEDAPRWKCGGWARQRVLVGSALELDALLPGERFDSIIFSPPYANRFDYFESMKVELWFGGFVGSSSDAVRLRKRSLRSHLGADMRRPAREVQALEELIAQMDQTSSSWRMGVPQTLRGYFDDMFQTLAHCRRLAPRGQCHVVVGNSAFAGTIVPTDTLIARLGLEAGFQSARLLVVRHLTVAPQQRLLLRGLEQHMRESVVVFE